MAGTPFQASRALLIGADHRSSTMALRDRMYVDQTARQGFFERLRRLDIDQAMILATADRVEILALPTDCDQAAQGITKIMADHAGASPLDIDNHTYVKKDEDALRHLFAVTAAIEGLVIGDGRILGELEESHRQAKEAGMSGEDLDSMLGAAYRAAARVRDETAIGHGAVSMASAAAQVAGDLHGDLAHRSGLLIGGGEMGETIISLLLKAGLDNLVVTHPSEARAEAVGRAFNCHVAPIESLGQLLESADIVLSAVSTRRYVISHEMIAAAIKARRHRPVLLIDTGIPGDIEPSVDALRDAFRYTLDDLERVAREGHSKGASQAGSAWEIVDSEVRRFLDDQTGQGARRAMDRLRRRADQARSRALGDADGDAERATRLLAEALLGDPLARLERLASEDGPGQAQIREQLLALINEIYRLEETDEDRDAGDGA